MKWIALALGLVGGLLAGAEGFMSYAVTFGQISNRVESYGTLVLLATLLGLAGGILVVGKAKLGANLMLAASAALGLLILQTMHWSLFVAGERDQALAEFSLANCVMLMVPVALLLLGAMTARRIRPAPLPAA